MCCKFSSKTPNIVELRARLNRILWKKNDNSFLIHHCILKSGDLIYCISHYFRVQLFSRFWTFAVIREWLISRFFWCCHYYKRHELCGNFREGLAREIRENKTLAKITAYTVDLFFHTVTTMLTCMNHYIKFTVNEKSSGEFATRRQYWIIRNRKLTQPTPVPFHSVQGERMQHSDWTTADHTQPINRHGYVRSVSIYIKAIAEFSVYLDHLKPRLP